MSKKKRPKKPTGTIGTTKFTVGPDGVAGKRTPVAFPAAKEEIEEFVARGFERDVKALPSAAAWYGPITHNPENDLDFDVASPDGRIKLELVEVVRKQHSREDQEAEDEYSPFEFARLIYDLIMKKSSHYASAQPLRKILLLYVTDWRSRIGSNELQLVQYWAAEHVHDFDYIYSYAVVTQTEGEVQVVFPVERAWEGFDPGKYRNLVARNISPARLARGI